MKFDQYGDPLYEPEWNQQFERARNRFRQNFPRILLAAAAVLVVLWLVSGIYVVGPGHVGVVRTFGKEAARSEPGLHYHLPWPVQKVDVVSTEQIRRIEVGFRSTQRVPEEALMLTGDENIVEALMVVQYRIADPSKYLFRLQDPDEALHAVTQVALRSTVGNMTIDQVMIEERAKVQDDARAFIQRLLEDYQSGLVVTEVKLLAADPPDAVKDAFHDVVRAREDRERLINQARGYQADLLPRARGAAEQILREAEAYQQQRVLRAEGEAARFLSVLAEYEKAKEVTRDRLHLETIEKILPEIDKMILDSDIGQRLVPLLPMGAGVTPFPGTVPPDVAPNPQPQTSKTP
ncbi:MAG TPA: FtsH protease activity modulator HflK [Clostridia bacterium]|nr:FtsH protease activity modulator HflK [Clostridia bacterium]